MRTKLDRYRISRNVARVVVGALDHLLTDVYDRLLERSAASNVAWTSSYRVRLSPSGKRRAHHW